MRLQPLSGKVLMYSTIVILFALCLGLVANTATAQVSPGRPSRTGYSASAVVQPIADAGSPQMAVTGATVLLDGSRSISASGAPLTYHWTFVSVPQGTSPVLSNADVVNPRFAVPADGTYVLELTVSDGTRSSSARVVVSTLFTPPQADAGSDQAVSPGSVVKLNGSRSLDPDGDALTFQWRLTYKPVDSFASLSNPAAIAPTFLADVAGTYVAQLTVTDSHNLSSTSSVTITTRDISPTAVAGNSQRVTTGTAVQLNGAASYDPNGDATSLVWNVISQPSDSSAFIASPNTVAPTFVPDTRGTYVLQLTVTDSQGNRSYSTMLVTTDPKAPSAALGQNKSVAPGEHVTLDGSKSADDDGVPLSYHWSLLAKPSGSNATIPSDLNASSVSFIADQPGEYLAELSVSNGIYTSEPTTVLITAAATGGHLVLSPNPIDFGSQPVGKTSSPMGLTITNTTSVPVQVLSILTTGANPGDFNIFNLRLPLLVNPNSASLVSVLFTPGDAGPRSATYIVNDDSGGLPNTVQLTGTGTQGTPKIALSPTNIPFGDQAVNTLSTPIRFTVTNSGDGPLWITNISFGGTNPNDFILPLNFPPPSSTSPLVVQPNGSTTIPITFAPKASGARNATVLLADNALGSPHSISVSGNGTGTASGVTVSPDSITFSDQTVGTTSAASLVTVTNNLNTAVQVTSLVFSGSNAADFSTTTVAPVTVAANGSVTIPVKFKPGAAQTRSATLTISDDTGGSAHTVSLSGKGVNTAPGLTVTPTTINFPNQAVNTTSSPVPVTITNGFTGNVTITGLLLLGTNAGDFTMNGIRTPLILAPGGTATLNILFTPRGDGPRSAAVVISDDTSGTTHRVELSGNNGGTGTPGISFNPTTLTFANQALGTTSASQSITVNNPGTAALQITALSFGGTNPGDFLFPANFTLPTASSPLSVAAGGSTTIPVSFKPTAAGARAATLLVTDNATGSPHSVGLSGTGGGTGVTVSPSSIVFADQAVGSAGAASSVTVTNFTNAAVQITALTFSGTNASDFSTTTAPPVTVAANGGTVTVPVKFTPGAAGSRSATLTVKDSSGGADHPVSLAGKGIDNTQQKLVINPTSLNFPTQELNTTSAPKQVTITNNYSEITKIVNVALLGANAGDFMLTGVPYPPDETGAPFWPYIMAPGATVSFNVLFTPRGPGARTAAVLISDDTHGTQYRVELTGNNPGPGINLSPATLTFGNQPVGTTSGSQSVTVTNPGSAALQITGVSISGTNAGDFLFAAGFTLPTPAAPLTVAAGGSATIPLNFKPTAEGTRSATLSLTDNATGSPHSVGLTGTGTPGGTGVTVSPSSITFADQLVNSTSAASQVTVTNFTNAIVQITTLSFSGTNASDFATTTVAPVSVAANGGTVTIPVKFTPGAIGSRSATLTVTDNSGGSQHTVTLSGKGINVQGVNVTPSALDFQRQNLNETSAPLPVVITNNTTKTVNITGLLLAGLNAAEFTITSSRTPFALAPNESRSLNILFSPRALGPRAGTLIVNDDSGGPTHTVALTGIGANGVAKIQWTPEPLNFGSVSVGTSSTPGVITITNTGTADLNITGLALGGTNAGDFAFPANFTPPTAATPIIVTKAGGTATLSVIFKPSAPGDRAASLLMTDDANFSPQSVTLKGVGSAPLIAFNPKPLTFVDQAIGTVSAPANLTITNTGNGELRITNMAFAGANAGDFAFAPNFVSPTGASPLVIAANGGSANIPIIFVPSAVGPRAASLTVTSNAPGSPHSADIKGNGLDSTVAVSPNILSFGQQLKATASDAKTVTITNTGDNDFQITSLSFTGDNAADFTVTDTVPITVTAKGGTATLHLVFTPAESGIRSATLVITDTAPGSPHMIPVNGIGIKPVFSITPTSLDFGQQAIPVESAPKSLLIRNLGSAPLHITKISFGGANPGDFKTDTVGPITIDPDNATATINVTFKPSAPAGARSATLIFEDDADNSPHTVNLTGTGLGQGVFSITPTSLTFDPVAVGSTSAPQKLTITNIGSADLFIDFVSRVGKNPSDFRYTVFGTLGSSDFPETLAPGQSVDMTITFAPGIATDSTRSATFLFHDNAADSPQPLVVTGTAVPSPANMVITPASLTFPSQQLNTTSSPLVLNLKNTGDADLVISTITFTGANPGDFAATPAAPIIIKTGVTTPLNVTFSPKGLNTRSATLNLISNSGGSTKTDLIPVTGTGSNQPGNIIMPSFTLGGNLEMLATASLDQVPASDLQVTITSKDPSKILLSPLSSDPSGTKVGVASITGIVPKGEGKFSGFPGFWVQALASSGTADIEITAQGYNTGKATVTLTTSAFVLNTPQGTGVDFGTTVGTDAFVSVSAVQLDTLTTRAVRPGYVANVAVTSSTTATGTIVGSPAVVQPGTNKSANLTFHPVAAGTTTLSITQPSGFFSSSVDHATATVTAPSIVMVPQSIGYNLVAPGNAQLDTPAPAGGLQVTINTGDSNKLRLSTSPTVAGTSSITLQVAGGSKTIPPFFLQALVGSGSTTMTALANGYNSASVPVAFFPTSVIINSPPGDGGDFATTSLSPETPLTLSLWQLSSNSRPLAPGKLRPGATAIASVTATNPAAGTVLGQQAQFVGGDTTNTTLSFLPSANCPVPCTSSLVVSQPSGFASPAQGGQITVTVNQPKVTLRIIQTTIGKNLQVLGSGALEAPAPDNVPVTISSDNPNVLLSLTPGDMGSSSITSTIFVGGGVNSFGFPDYYVQSLGSSGTANLTVSVPGYTSSTFTVTLAPAGIVIAGPNVPIGTDFGILASGGNRPLTVSANVLDPNTLLPTQLTEAVRGGLSVPVTVTSSAPSVASLLNPSFTMDGGVGTVTVMIVPNGQGSTYLSVGVPAGFSPPSVGQQLKLTVN